MRGVISQWRQLVRDYAGEFGTTRCGFVRDSLLGVASIAVVILNLVAIAAIIPGASQ